MKNYEKPRGKNTLTPLSGLRINPQDVRHFAWKRLLFFSRSTQALFLEYVTITSQVLAVSIQNLIIFEERRPNTFFFEF